VATAWRTGIFILAALIVAVMVNADKPSARGETLSKTRPQPAREKG
jgi:hypothetical protein